MPFVRSCRRWPGALLAVALAAGGLAGLAGPTRPAYADEVYPVPAGGSFTVDGHGWGHGHGLSQWGAEGAAVQGVAYRSILDFYYPGTATGTTGSVAVNVALTDTGDEAIPPSGSGDHRYECDDASSSRRAACTLNVVNTGGLVVTDRASGRTWQSTSYRLWGVKAAADGLVLTRLDGTAWATVATRLAGPVTFGGPATVRVLYTDGTARDYRGSVQAARTGASRFVRLNVVGIDDYLRGVVPRESPASWHAAALAAQAVAARSYAMNVRAESQAAGRPYDICDSTYCQVYGGYRLVQPDGGTVALEAASTNAAVSATAGEVRTYQGRPIFAQFSSSNGGWSAAGGAPYLAARADPYDGYSGNPVHSWTTTLSVSSLQAMYPSVGRLVRVRVTQRDGNGDWGGRVVTAVLEGVDSAGSPTSVTVSHPRFRMRTEWWHIRGASTTTTTPPTVSGPPTVERGATVTLTGTAPPGRAVELWLHAQNSTGYRHVSNTVAGGDGRFRTAFPADIDYRYYVVSAGAQSPSGLTQARGTTLAGPDAVPAGAAMTVEGLAYPGSTVQVTFDPQGGPVTNQATAGAADQVTATADARGHWRATYTPPSDVAYTAAAAGYTSQQVSTRVYQPVTLTGPATAARGATVTLSGSTDPGARVTVWFHKQNVAGYVARRWLTVGPDGTFSTTYVGDVDYRYYATRDDTASRSAAGLTQVAGTTVGGPATVARGATVRLGGLAAPGSRVVVWFHKQGVAGYTARRWLTADAAGRWATSYVADVDYRYYAVAAGHTSTTWLTQAR